MTNDPEIDLEAIARKKQHILEVTLYRFRFVGEFFALPDLDAFPSVDRKALVDRYAEDNEPQRKLFAAISEQKIEDLVMVLDAHAQDPDAFNFNDLRTYDFSVLLHLWLSYFPKHTGALAVVEKLDMSNREKKLCLDVIMKDIAEIDEVLETASKFAEELDIKFFNPFVYAEIKRLDKMFSLVESNGSLEELEHLLDHPVNASRRSEHVLRWAHHFKNNAVLQFLNTKYKLIENANSRRDDKLVAFYVACGIQDVPRWSLVESVSLATTDFFARSVSTVSQYVRSFWDAEQNSLRGNKK